MVLTGRRETACQGEQIPLGVRSPSFPPRAAACALALLLSDSAAVLASTVLASLERTSFSSFPSLPSLGRHWLLGSAVLLGLFHLLGLYTLREVRAVTVRRIFAGIGIFLLLAAAAMIKPTSESQDLGRLGILVGLTLLALLPLTRLLMVAALDTAGLWKTRALVFGTSDATERLRPELERDLALGYKIVKAIPANGTGVDAFERRSSDDVVVDEIVVLAEGLNLRTILGLVRNASLKVAAFTVVTTPRRSTRLPGRRRPFQEKQVLITLKNRWRNPVCRAAKRTMDLVLSIIALTVLLPVMALLSLLIKLDSRGPVFFSHPRLGRNARAFSCYKFRTMVVNAESLLKDVLEKDERKRQEWDRYHKLRDDCRLTRIGRFLRKTSLDELPQLLNVLIGHMSLVGPRPYAIPEEPLLGEDQETILSIRPGITGLWQIKGRSAKTFMQRVMLEKWYVQNWSLGLDLVILARTAWVVLTTTRGAY